MAFRQVSIYLGYHAPKRYVGENHKQQEAGDSSRAWVRVSLHTDILQNRFVNGEA
jgi:hypothetical protein